MFKGSQDIQTIEQARAYLKSRAKDAVDCYFRSVPRQSFKCPIALAQYLAKYW